MYKILVIDDDIQVRSMLKRVLEREGYEVLLAGNGIEGLRKIRAEPCHLVIIDLIMPEKEGIETIGEIHKEFPDVTIFAMSGGIGGSKIDLLPAALYLGAIRTFPKPLDIQELITSIKENLDYE